MNTLKKYFRMLLAIVSILLGASFLLMVINIMIFYGFTPSMIHYKETQPNPFGLTIAMIFVIHLTVGFIAGIGFSKRYLLSGSMGLLCAFLFTGISLLYFGWREDLESVEILIPLVFGILPAFRLFDYLNHKYPVRSKQEEI